MTNQEIRSRLFNGGVHHYQLAQKIGISSFTLSVWLRSELSGERLERVERALEALEREVGTNG